MEIFWFLIFIFLLAVLIGGWPTWPYARTWDYGYTPSAVAAMLLVLYFFLIWFGIIAVWWPWAAYY